MQQIPVYVFTGFLDSGKTKFIQETFEDERFNAGERTLLLVFEEGEEEYDFSTYPHKNVFLEVLDQTAVTTRELAALAKKHKVERVVAELNGMQQVGELYMKLPEDWVVAQEVMFADSTTFQAYNANMRNLCMDKMVGAQMIVFNRLEKGADIMPFHKIARAANRKVDILYDYTDGTTQFDDIEDPLPFDINAPVIEVKDEDYALWYRDVTEEPEKYDGKTVRFKAQVAMLRRDKDNMFAPGRFVMTCCVDDIQFCGIPCRYNQSKTLESRSWVMVTAKISAEKHKLYKGGTGPVLTALSVEKNAVPAEPDVAEF
jgi:G3E family GTPase